MIKLQCLSQLILNLIRISKAIMLIKTYGNLLSMKWSQTMLQFFFFFFFFFLYSEQKITKPKKTNTNTQDKKSYLRSTAHKVNKINKKLIKRKLIL